MVNVTLRLLALAALLLCAGAAHGASSGDACAGDGEPPPGPIAVSGLISAEALPYLGGDLLRRLGDPGDAGVRVLPGRARVAFCGRVRLRRGELVYSLGYEPYSADEAAHTDAAPWGRLLAAEVGYPILRWLTLYGGIRKVAFSYGHDEPEQSLALPVRPYLSNALSPDRRLGLTLDDNWGPARVILGLYETARTFAEFPASGIMTTVRGVLEPLGPVGRTVSTFRDDPDFRPRFRIAINLSILLSWSPQPDTPLSFVLGGDVPLKIGPLGLVVEYLYARATPVEAPTDTPELRQDRQGLWAQAALMLLRPYVEVEGRYEWLDTPADDRQRFHALTAGLTGYLRGDLLKVQAAYGHKFHYAGPLLHDDYLLLRLQVAH